MRGTADDPQAKAAVFAKQLEQLDPAFFGEPQVRFPLAAAHRHQGLPRQAERFYLALRHSRPHDAWWAAAQSELWLAERQGQPPKPLWNCPRAASKPRLDGRLDEPVWRAGNVVELRSPIGDDKAWPGTAMLAYDAEFLYLGVTCRHAPGMKYEADERPRPRDADLSDRDRVELLIDVDRDFATYYRLAVDHRGWTAESCWGDASWNPDWFVAHSADEASWTIEAAIPLSELTGQAPRKAPVGPSASSAPCPASVSKAGPRPPRRRLRRGFWAAAVPVKQSGGTGILPVLWSSRLCTGKMPVPP